jgi:hypothetical protein
MAYNPTVLVPTEAGTRSVERSEESAFRKADCIAAGEDDVIQDPDIDEP